MQLVGAGARATTIDANGSSRALQLADAATVTVAGLTIQDGYALSDSGGNILNEGVLTLSEVWLTEGLADNEGGGVANVAGTLTVERSLIEGNNALFGGGGIANIGTGGGASRPDRPRLDDLRRGREHGRRGILTRGNTGNVIELVHVTFNQNTPDAIDIASAPTTSYGSIYTINAGDTCGSTLKPTDLGYNVDSGNTCAFTGTGSLEHQSARRRLAEQPGRADRRLHDPGRRPGRGPRRLVPVHARPARLPARVSATDRCDAGAYEIQCAPTRTRRRHRRLRPRRRRCRRRRRPPRPRPRPTPRPCSIRPSSRPRSAAPCWSRNAAATASSR